MPGAAPLPLVPGRDADAQIPELELELADVAIDPGHLAADAKVCRFGLRDELPASYLLVVAFPLHLALMADPRFPFDAVGLVHVANRITRHRPVRSASVSRCAFVPRRSSRTRAGARS